MAETIKDATCLRIVAKRDKVYDDECKGFYVSILPPKKGAKHGVATFGFKFWHTGLKQQVPITIGVFHPERLTATKARKLAFGLKAKGDDALDAKPQEPEAGMTVNELIKEFIDYIKVVVKKPHGVVEPRTASWEGYQGLLNRFAAPRFGDTVATAITKKDIGKLMLDIQAGKFRNGKKTYAASISNARNLKTALQAMFGYAAEAGREYVPFSPCLNLPELDPEIARERVLTADEIRWFWWGLDHPDCPCTREVALGLKLELTTMLRTKEFLTGVPGELLDRGTDVARFTIPAYRVKKRKPLITPLNGLAQEVLAEAITDQKQPHILSNRSGEAFDRAVLSKAVRGSEGHEGVLQFLEKLSGFAWERWTPHDLRRTAATLARNEGVAEWKVSKCLDHAVEEGEQAVPQITGVYVHSKFVGEKVEVMEAVERALRGIIGERPVEMLQAA